jgi:glutaredoxin 2
LLNFDRLSKFQQSKIWEVTLFALLRNFDFVLAINFYLLIVIFMKKIFNKSAIK